MSKDEIKVPPKAPKEVKKPKGESWIKKSYQETKQTITNVYDGASHLVLSVALVICAYYNYEGINNVSPFEYYARTIASVVIALVGAWAIVKIFKNLGESK